MPTDDPAPDTGTDDTTTPATGDDTDWQAEAEKWKKLARQHENRAKANHAELEKVKTTTASANQSDMEKIQAQLQALTERAEKAERKALLAEVAQDKGLTPGQANRLRGNTREELEADADDMVEAFGIKAKPGKGDDEPDTGDTTGDKDSPDGAKPAGGKPKEKLRPGAAGESAADEIDPAKIADSVLKSPF